MAPRIGYEREGDFTTAANHLDAWGQSPIRRFHGLNQFAAQWPVSVNAGRLGRIYCSERRVRDHLPGQSPTWQIVKLDHFRIGDKPGLERQLFRQAEFRSPKSPSGLSVKCRL